MIETFRRIVHRKPMDTFRRLAHWPIPDYGENAMLRSILGGVRETTCLYGCEAEIIESTAEVTGMTGIRDAQIRALKTTVSNEGEADAQIYEDGKLILFVPSRQTREMPLRGKHAMEAESDGTVITVTTHLRCQCSQPDYAYGESVYPIGEFLL